MFDDLSAQASGRFDFTALSVGTASLSFSAVSADLGGAADALVIQLDVLGESAGQTRVVQLDRQACLSYLPESILTSSAFRLALGVLGLQAIHIPQHARSRY